MPLSVCAPRLGMPGISLRLHPNSDTHTYSQKLVSAQLKATQPMVVVSVRSSAGNARDLSASQHTQSVPIQAFTVLGTGRIASVAYVRHPILRYAHTQAGTPRSLGCAPAVHVMSLSLRPTPDSN